MNLTRLTRALPWLALAVMALALLLHILQMPLVGDDFIYGVYYPAQKGILKTMAGIYTGCNARLGDLLAPLLLAAPRWLPAFCCAAMLCLLFCMLKALGGVSSSRPGLLACLFALATLVFPFWNGFYLFVVQTGYVWSTALAALSLFIITGRQMRSSWWLLYLPVALASGFGHELAGPPLALALIIWLIWVRKAPLSLPKKLAIVCVCLGALFSISSPGSWSRVFSGTSTAAAGDSPLLTLVSGGFLGILLIIDLILLRIYSPQGLKSLCRTVWLPLVVVSLASLPVMAVSGVAGRTGMAVQFFALAALCRQYVYAVRREPSPALECGLAWLVSALLCLQYIGIIYWQRAVDEEACRQIETYRQNPEKGMPAANRTSLPVYLTGKVPPSFLHDDPWNGEALGKGISQTPPAK